MCAFPHQPESATLRLPEKCPIVQKTPEVERKAAAKVSARPPPSYKEVEQHVRSGAATFVFCSAACGAPSARSRSLFYTHTHTPVIHNHPHPRSCPLPDRPVRAGPHLPKLSVALRHFPFGFVDILAVVTGSDSLGHGRNSEILPGEPMGLICFVPPVATHPLSRIPTNACSLGGCAVRLRVSRSGRTHRSQRATQELHKPAIKGEQR